MKRVSVYLKDLRVSGILSKKDPSGKVVTLECCGGKKEHFISSSYMSPGDEYNLMASSSVTIHTLNKDNDTDEIWDLGSSLTTENLIKIEVRSFDIRKTASLQNKDSQKLAVVVVDLVF